MLSLKNGRIEFNRDRCCQCGVCLPSCPTGALSSQPNGRGFFDIICNHAACIACNVCVKVCPPHWLQDDRATPDQIRNAPGVYLAHARDERVRWMSSSGGVARTIIGEVLARGIVDAVYSLVYPEGPDAARGINVRPALPKSEERVLPTGKEVTGVWLTKAPPIKRIPCSIYRPVLWGAGLGGVNQEWRRVLLVGLPCQLKGAERLLKKLSPKTDLLRIAIFCRKQKILGHSECIKKMTGQLDAKTGMVYYRGAGWPGKSGVYSHGQPFDVDYFFHARCWTLPACYACPDCLCAGSADITLADPWGIVHKQDDPVGSNLAFAWTQTGKTLLEQLENAIALKACATDDAERSVDFDGQVAEKLRAMAYHLGQETSIFRRLRGLLSTLGTRIAEIQLGLMHPQSFPIRAQLVIKAQLRAVARKIGALVSGRSSK